MALVSSGKIVPGEMVELLVGLGPRALEELPFGPYFLLVGAPDGEDSWTFVRDLSECVLRGPREAKAASNVMATSENPTLGIEAGEVGPGDHIQLLSELGRTLHGLVPLRPRPGEAELTIGRARESSVVLSDASVSAQHAAIRVVGGDACVTDRGSKNGTLVNGVMLSPGEETWLQPMDRIDFGRIQAFVADPRALRALLRQDLRTVV